MSPTRSALLGATTAIALVGTNLMTRFVLAAQGADPADITTLNAAIELERAGIKAYDDAAATNLLHPDVLKIALGFRADHIAHRDALIAAVKAGGGNVSANTAKLDYPSLKSQADVLRFAEVVERKAASTYLSVIPDLKNRDLASAAAAILGVETTHVATLAAALGEGRPYPNGFVT